MKKQIPLILFGFFLLANSSCVEVIRELPSAETAGDKVLLIEDYTGVRCTNCPTAAAEIRNLELQYEGKVIPVAIHAPKFFTFTKPYNDPDAGKVSKYDFTISEADILIDNAGEIIGLPSAAFDRTDFRQGGLDGTIVTNIANYSVAAESVLEKEPLALVSLEKTYDRNTRNLKLDVNVRALSDIEEELYLTVYVLESHLIDLQTGKEDFFYEYEHNHLLRDLISEPLGDLIAGEGLSENELLSVSYEYSIPADSEGLGWWNVENMHVVAFVHSGDPHTQVHQAGIWGIIE